MALTTGNLLTLASLHWVDVGVIVVYLLGVAALSVWCSTRNTSTEAYFLGNRSLPVWAVALSMVGTSISSVTFLALPAAAFALDWRMIVPNLMLPFVAVLAIVVFIPFFRRGRATTAFEYLEQRYGPIARLYGAASFIALQMIRLGAILYLVSLPVSFALGAPIPWVIVLGGLFVVLYTAFGGIEADVWTDVVQTIVLWLGGIVSMAVILFAMPDGLGDVFTIGVAHDKFHFGDFEFDLGRRTFWTMAILGLVSWLGGYVSDQTVVQRYLAVGSTRQARQAAAWTAVLSVPTWAFFFFIGSCLFAYYTVHPDPAVAGLEADQVFPHFLLTQVPTGLTGLIIAAVVAAAMSSLDSGINSISTVSISDILRRHLMPGRSDRFYLKLAKALSLTVGLMMIGAALVFHVIPQESIVNATLIVGSLFGGGLIGLYMLGFFTTRVTYRPAMIALGLAVLVNLYLMLNTAGWLPAAVELPIHAYWVGVLVNALFIAAAYGLSWLPGIDPRRSDLTGLTVWTMDRGGSRGDAAAEPVHAGRASPSGGHSVGRWLGGEVD